MQTYLHPSVTVLRAPLNTAAMACPPVMNMTFIVTNIPRWLDDAVSAKYIGTAMLARPFFFHNNNNANINNQTENNEIITKLKREIKLKKFQPVRFR